MTHICIGNLTIVGSDNGLSPGRHQAIMWTSAGILLIGPLKTNFNEILIEILTFSLKKMRLKISSAKWRPFRLGLNVLIDALSLQHWWHISCPISRRCFSSNTFAPSSYRGQNLRTSTLNTVFWNVCYWTEVIVMSLEKNRRVDGMTASEVTPMSIISCSHLVPHVP